MDIVIGKPYLESRTEDSILHSRLCCDIEGVNDDILTLWYEVPSEYEEYLCIERADAFIVSLLPLAMIRSSPEQLVRIICKQSISAKLYHQLVNYYIPVLVDSISYYNDIVLEANISESKLFCKGAVGTGVSGGVDSSYTIARYLNNKISAFRLSHCVYYEMGLYGSFDSDLEKHC
ncbi:hypothetical protein [Marispirochaeta aestuarii]|uniref:hypothetical protein n=1 Tax=Marispirochaeta aestuarii TaxID=1963862 RepID=UPI0029C6CC15|nr:hypothetical protein [Marispirochaeta aestuarii]